MITMVAEKYVKLDDLMPALKELSNGTICGSFRIPVVEAVEVVHAEWVLRQSNGYAVCSHCCHGDYVDPMATHCRYCGALMKQ